ncbi:MAG: branched-chain-amino-acid transaminase [bacterium]
MKIYIDGCLFDEEDAKISVFDHGLLYGDGVFEGMRIYGGRLFRPHRHIARLQRGAKIIQLEIPMSADELIDAISLVAQENGFTDRDGYVRLVVTRGKGDLGLDPRACPKPSVIIIVGTIKLYPTEDYENGLALMTTAIRRNSPDACPPQVKSLNYMNNILAKLEANRYGAKEAIFLNHLGYVAEATADNIFIVQDGRIMTPPVRAGALPGITRHAVIEIAADLEIPAEERNILLLDIYSADECFLTGTAAKIVPVTQVDGRMIGSGQPGSITRRLMSAFAELTEEDGILVAERAPVAAPGN